MKLDSISNTQKLFLNIVNKRIAAKDFHSEISHMRLYLKTIPDARTNSQVSIIQIIFIFVYMCIYLSL